MNKWDAHDAACEEYEANNSAQVEEGEYQAVIEDIDIAHHPRWNDEQIRWIFRISTGPDEGARLIRWHSLDASRIQWLFKDLARFGIRVRRVSELGRDREKYIGCHVVLEVKYTQPDPQYEPDQKVWFIEMLQGQEAASPARREPQHRKAHIKGDPDDLGADDVPF